MRLQGGMETVPGRTRSNEAVFVNVACGRSEMNVKGYIWAARSEL